MTDAISRAIARYAVADLPFAPEVRKEAERRVLDSVGVALGAFHQPAPQAARRYASGLPLEGGSTVWGTTMRVPPDVAALVNGVTIRYLDFSDTYFSRDSTHPSDMIGGMVAVAEHVGRTGRDVLDAIAMGYEVATALCDGLGIRSQGWDQTNITAVGACAGIARLMELSEQQTAHAVAMTVVPRAGMLQARFGNVAMWKAFGGPDSVKFAAYSCALAAAGVEGPNEPFEGPRGMFRLLMGGKEPDRDAFMRLEPLPPPRRILDTHMKAFAVGTVAQGAVAAALGVYDQLAPGEEILDVRVKTFEVAIEVMASAEKYAPLTRETADHSLPYVVTMALRDGNISETTYANERYRDPDIHAFLHDHVHLSVDPELDGLYPEGFPAHIEVDTSAGRTLEHRVDYPPGMARNPMSESMLEKKFASVCSHVIGEDRVPHIIDVIRRLIDAPDVAELVQALILEPRASAA